MGTIRLAIRFVLFLLLTTYIVVVLALIVPFSRNKIRMGMRLRKHYARIILPVLGVRLQKSGTAPNFPCILMGNHRSYLDPIVLLCDVDGVPVSKAEMASWPLIGVGARISGVLFLKRESSRSRQLTLEAIGEKLDEGYPVILFPEGTTHSGDRTIKLKKGGFQLAVEKNLPVVPVAMDYRYQNDHWIGDDSFLGHFTRRFARPAMPIRVAYGEPIRNTDPHELLRQCQEWIDAHMLQWKSEGWNGPD
jgi:1-acyl-sn-glycerol-3-phosphate acyltransferase